MTQYVTTEERYQCFTCGTQCTEREMKKVDGTFLDPTRYPDPSNMEMFQLIGMCPCCKTQPLVILERKE